MDGKARSGDRLHSWWQGKVKMLVAQLCLTLSDPVDGSPPGSFVRGILQATVLKWVAIPFSRGSSWPKSPAAIPDPSLQGLFLTQVSGGSSWPKSLGALPDPSLRGLFLTQVSRGSSWPKHWNWISCVASRFFYQLSHQGSLMAGGGYQLQWQLISSGLTVYQGKQQRGTPLTILLRSIGECLI